MNWILFIIIIPGLAGATSSSLGLTLSSHPLLYTAVNLPIIIASVVVYNLWFKEKEKN